MVALLAAAVRATKWYSVFVEDGVMDPYRPQAQIADPSLTQQLQDALGMVNNDLNPDWRPTHPLRSEAHQISHHDYLAAGRVRKTLDELPGGCILSLHTKHSFRHLRLKRHGSVQERPKMVEIPPGHVIMFCGELVRAQVYRHKYSHSLFSRRRQRRKQQCYGAGAFSRLQMC